MIDWHTNLAERHAAAALTAADTARLAVLQETGLLDVPPEAAFERLTSLAIRLIGAPVALVSLVDASRQFFQSSVGLAEPWATARETPLSHSFCQYVVAESAPLVVNDAREHPLVCENLAIPDLGVIAYAGMPLITADRATLGSFCVIDTQPREWSERELAILHDLAAVAMTEIELRLAMQQLSREREAVRQAHQRLTFHVENSPLAVIECDRELRISRWSPGAERIFGWPAEAIVGKRADSELALFDDADLPRAARTVQRLFTNRDERNVLGCRNLTQEGRTIHCEWHNSVLRDREGAVVSLLALVQEVTAQVQLREQLAQQALHDPLTGLPNRASLAEQFRQLLAQDRRFGLLFLDLNGFKAINDTHGHAIGDELLIVIARRLARVVRSGDTVVRLGGGEFVVIMDSVWTEEEALALANRVSAAIMRPITLTGQHLTVGTSIGIAISAAGGDDPDELLLAADAAMYEAKRAKDGPRFAAPRAAAVAIGASSS